MGYKVEATIEGFLKTKYFPNEISDVKKVIPKFWKVDLSDLSIFKINDEDIEFIKNNNIKKYNENIEGVTQNYNDESESGKIKYITRTYDTDEVTEITTITDNITKTIVGELI